MQKKAGKNFYLPPPIADLFEELCEPYGAKQKWMVISAALLVLAELPPEKRGFYYGRVSGSDATGELADLIEQAKRGELAKLAMVGRITQPIRAGQKSPAR